MVFWTRIIDRTEEHWHGGERGIQRMARLLTREWDVFVFVDIPLVKVPIEQQYESSRPSPMAPDWCCWVPMTTRAQGQEPVQGTARLPGRRGRREGLHHHAGSGPAITQASVIEYRPGWEVEYDEWAMRLGKAILWAAGREPKLNLTLTPKGKELARATLPAVAATLRWQGASSGIAADITLRRADGEVVVTTRQILDKPEGDLDVSIPLVRVGQYYLDAVARDGNRGGWLRQYSACSCLSATGDSAYARPGLGRVGQKLSGKVQLAGESRAGQRLVISLIDRRDREIVRQIVTADTAEQAFRFAVQPWFPMLLQVRVTADGWDE